MACGGSLGLIMMTRREKKIGINTTAGTGKGGWATEPLKESGYDGDQYPSRGLRGHKAGNSRGWLAAGAAINISISE